MKKISILFDANSLLSAKSGVGYYTQGLIRSLAKSGGDSINITGHFFNFLGRKSPVSLPKAVNVNYIESRLIPGKIVNICRRIGFQLPYELFANKIADIVFFPNYATLPTIRKNKKAVAVHDLSFIDCPEFVSDKNRDFLQKWVPRSIKNSDLVITISEFTKSRIKEVYGVSDDKIHVTPIPPVDQVQPDTGIIEKYGLGEGFVLFVGTIEPRKNITGLLEAYSLLDDDIKHKWPLVLAGGKGWHDEKILERIETLKNAGLNIVQTGYITDAERSALYQGSSLCVLPSHYEGFGMPVLEAMSYGKAVALSDIPVLHEVAGDAGIYFNQNDPQSIADCIAKTLTTPGILKKYGELSNDRIASYPSWDAVAADLLIRLRDLV